MAMNRARIILALGIWVAILPYLGFPYTLKSIIFVITGLGIMYLSFVIYREVKNSRDNFKKVFENFSESNNKNTDENGTA